MKYFLVFASGVLFCAIVFGAYFVYTNYKISPKSEVAVTIATEDKMDEEVAPLGVGEKIIDKNQTPSVTPVAGVTVATEKVQPSVSGALGYPSSFVPAMKVCLYEYAGPGMIQGPKYCSFTKDNDNTFTMKGAIVPSKYVVFAWPSKDAAGSSLTGSYTPAVACGLSVDCKDHAPINFDLNENPVVTGLDIKDWYAPEGTFPTKPSESGVTL